MIGPHWSLPPRQVFTFESKNAWICASVIVDVFVKTASLMMLPAEKPSSEVFTGPPATVDTADVDAAVTGEADAAAGATVTKTIATAAASALRRRTA
ncbi:hypothetical protein GCM10022383_03100 [Microbacterium soli]|uniref:Uncharacterized protein n=1 Tax=Microbacterium soli TaxID=446075 RepID=A0ABP7MS40_9MICO